MNAPLDRPVLKAKDQPDLSRFNWEDALLLEDQLPMHRKSCSLA
jgi:hypothetical protein